MKVWFLVEVIVRHVSEPCSNTDFSLELQILSLVLMEMLVEFHTCRKMANACLVCHDVFVCASWLADLAAQVHKLTHIFYSLSLDGDWGFLLIVGAWQLGLLPSDLQSDNRQRHT